ncbi:MAG TPA: hypothetical protein VFQ88_00115 [Nevskiaceae bacterium]|nr:hypothetical protein [Nevskiaceae bacterium]
MAPDIPLDYQPQAGNPVDGFRTLRQLRHAMRPPGGSRINKPAIAVAHIKQVHTDGPLTQWILRWAVWMLQGGTGYRYHTASVLRYLDAFGKPLIAAAGEINPADESPEALAELYETVLQEARSPSQRSSATIGLSHFHSYLVAAAGLPSVEIGGALAGERCVRANTVSEIEFARMSSVLRRSSLSGRDKGMFGVMLTLLYRLGLRRNELLWLCVNDLQIDVSGKRPMLWVHAHPKASLKTSASTRRLPLAHLLSCDDWKDLRAWRDRRVRELGQTSPAHALLFCKHGMDTERIADHYVDFLVAVARDVCGDPSLVLHSFRHAFACNLFVQIMHAGWLQRVNSTRHPASTVSLPWPNTSLQKQTSSTPLMKHFVQDRLPRSATYLVSMHAGHVDPTETTRTYLHHQDYLAYLYLRELAAGQPTRLWAALEGITEGALKVRHSRHKKGRGEAVPPHLDTPTHLLRRAHLKRPPGQTAHWPDVEPIIRAWSDQQSVGLSLDATYRALATTRVEMSTRARELVTGVDVEFLREVYRNAHALAGCTTRTRNLNARRSRHLRPRHGSASPGHRAQLDGLAPALPRRKAQLYEARRVFEKAVSSRDPALLEGLVDLLERTSRSDPALTFDDLGALSAAIGRLQGLGVYLTQMQVEIRALPKACPSRNRWRADVRRYLRGCVSVCFTGASATPVSRRHTPAGRLALKIMLDDRQSAGWRVGVYYAASVVAARAKIRIADLLSQRLTRSTTGSATPPSAQRVDQ